MTALLLTIAIFLFFAAVGLAVLALLSSQNPLQQVLTAPAFGICVTTIPAFYMSRLDMPVQSFATPLVIVLGLFAVGILAWKRPRLPVLPIAAIGIPLATALLLIGRPMFSFGLNWTSYANDDMANYCMSAARFLTDGYITPPNLADFLGGRDYAEAYWNFQFRGIRSGPDIILSAVWAVTHVNALYVFMPTICALQLSMVSASAAIAASATPRIRAVLVTGLLIAVSPLATLGVLYQLLAQIGGVAILCGAVAILCRPPPAPQLRECLTSGAVAVIAVAGLLIWYPESTPFIGVGVSAYLALFAYRSPKDGLRLFAFYAVSALTAVALLNTYALSALVFVIKDQVGVGFNTNDNVLFPYFLIPSGISAFWGLTQMVNLPGEPYLSTAILGGIGMFALLLFILRTQIRLVVPAGIFCALMVLVGGVMVYRNADYGLFKLAMFMQPFVAAAFGSAIALASRRGVARLLAVLVVVGALNAWTQKKYVDASFGSGDTGTLADLQGASKAKVYEQFAAIFDEARRNSPKGVLSETPNPVVAKFQALNSRGQPTYFLTNDFFGGLMFGRETTPLAQFNEKYLSSSRTVKAADEIAARKRDNPFYSASINGNSFNAPKGLEDKLNLPLIVSNGQGTVINKFEGPDGAQDLHFSYAKDLTNYLIFVPSSLGNYYYGGGIGTTSYYQLEHDPLFPGQKFSALGRHLLFMVRGTTPEPRLLVEVTSTVAKQFDSKLPDASANGASFGFVGRGSGRLSIPVKFIEFEGVPYLGIDFGRDGKPFIPEARGWLMSLFGRKVDLDWRSVIGFGREISLISTQQYRALQAPAAIQKFPADLANKGLEYSGTYEDSWISEHSFFMLQPRATDRSIRIKGLIPMIDDKLFKTKLRVLVDGAEIFQKDMEIGYYDFRLPLGSATGRHRIELIWDKAQKLPGDDGRATAGQIAYIGYSEEAP